MHTAFLRDYFLAHRTEPALLADDGESTFGDLLELSEHWTAKLDESGVQEGSVVALEGDYSSSSIATFFALVDLNCIVVPLSRSATAFEFELAEPEFIATTDGVTSTGRTPPTHALYRELRDRRHPGLVLFSSGTSGEPKAAVHDFTFLLDKFRTRRPALRTVAFLPFDHWGGLNTMLHTLSNGAALVTLRERAPEEVCLTIQRNSAELLPTTPTFLNLLLLSESHQHYDLTSLRLITYGAEPMPDSTLERLKLAFPNVRLQQTYGLIEVGVLRSKSRADGSLWVKLGGEGYETRVVDGILQIRSTSTILGYLNAPTPITADGWFVTGDAVIQDGEYFRVLGRQSELINVGGDKVYPAEVESVIQSMANVDAATVYGEKNALVGAIVCARVTIRGDVDVDEFAAEVKRFCGERLERFKVPVKVDIVKEANISDRFKKRRR